MVQIRRCYGCYLVQTKNRNLKKPKEKKSFLVRLRSLMDTKKSKDWASIFHEKMEWRRSKRKTFAAESEKVDHAFSMNLLFPTTRGRSFIEDCVRLLNYSRLSFFLDFIQSPKRKESFSKTKCWQFWMFDQNSNLAPENWAKIQIFAIWKWPKSNFG